MIRRGFGLVGLSLVLLMAAGASAQGETVQRFWSHLRATGCINTGSFERTFEPHTPAGSPWRVYTPISVPNTISREAAPHISELIRRFWAQYRALLDASPGDASHPLRVVAMNQIGEIGYGQRVGGMTGTSCGGGNHIYIFVPSDPSDEVTRAAIAHELFHGFQVGIAPEGEYRSVSNWFNEGTATWAEEVVSNYYEPAGREASMWRYPQASLDSLLDYNPGNVLPEWVNGVYVKLWHPYMGGKRFTQFLAGYFGVQATMELSSPSDSLADFGHFLRRVFASEPGRFHSVRQYTAEMDEIIDRELKTSHRSRATVPDGLNEAYGRFSASHLYGIAPPAISLSPDFPGTEGLDYFSWLFRTERLPTGTTTVELRADNPLSTAAVTLLPDSSAKSALITITGQLPEEGRLYMQDGDRGIDASAFGGGIEPLGDFSKNARTNEDPSAPATAEDFTAGSRQAFFCMSSDPAVSSMRWFNTGGMRVVLANTSLTGSAVPVSIKFKVEVKNRPCQRKRRDDEYPADRNTCPSVPPAGPDGEPLPDPCGPVDVESTPPPSTPPPYPGPIKDPWSVGQRSLDGRSSGVLAGESGVDCESNRRDRAAARRAGRTRTASERVIDRYCDRLRRESRDSRS